MYTTKHTAQWKEMFLHNLKCNQLMYQLFKPFSNITHPLTEGHIV